MRVLRRPAGKLLAMLPWLLAPQATFPIRAQEFVRGDANDDGRVNITDPFFTLRSLFSVGAKPRCEDASDVNDDGSVDIGDAIFTLSYLFRGGSGPFAPGLECGPDPTEDLLACLDGSSCVGDWQRRPPDPEERDAEGNYSPYHTPGEMRRPRYLHEVVVTPRGMPIAMGGTDERGYSSLDTVEMFDPYVLDKENPSPPPKAAGVWIDTDFEGNPIVFRGGPRIRFTASYLGGGKVLVAGGSSDLIGGKVYPTVELYDVETRRFEVLPNEMVYPRFRHTAIALADGTWLFVGGQTELAVNVPIDLIPEALRELPARLTRRFLTTPYSEIFSPVDNKFVSLTFLDTDRASRLATPRGRSGHAMERIAGPDGLLRTPDDLFLVVGGFQGMEGRFAPDHKMQGTVGRGQAVGLTTIEVFDPSARSFFQVTAAELSTPRINDPYIINLGHFNDSTPDGVVGMGNMILVTHGNDDDTFATAVEDDLFTAAYTGFGPAHGLQLFRVADGFQGHFQGAEYAATSPPFEPRANLVGRCGTNPVVLARNLQTAQGVAMVVTWAVAAAGVDRVPDAAGSVENFGPTVRAGCVFDPLYSLPAVALGRSARDLALQRSATNPLGVVGCWLTLDGALPTVNAADFGTTPLAGWAKAAAARRVHSRSVPLPGKDRILNTPDDLVLLTGGSVSDGDPFNAGGDLTQPSTEILVPPLANAKAPSP